MTVFGAIEQLFPFPEAEDDAPYESWPRLQGFPKNYERESDSALAPEQREPYVSPPLSPFDLFAAAAYLLDISGAYHHVVPEAPAAPAPHSLGAAKRVLHVDKRARRTCLRMAKLWRKPLDTALDYDEALIERSLQLRDVHALWDRLLGCWGDAPVFHSMPDDEPPPKWWRLALQLMIIADETAKDAGFEITLDEDTTRKRLWFMRDHEVIFTERYRKWLKYVKQLENPAGGTPHALRPDGAEWTPDDDHGALPATLAWANPDIACVIPKSRTAAVGCTMRSLSHHLALLPPHGVARARWMPLLRPKGATSREDNEFNILLVPFPFSISDQAFVANPDLNPNGANWGMFSLNQYWRHGYDSYRRAKIVDDLIDFIEELAKQATRSHGATRIDAVVFPELALDHRIFRGLIELLPNRIPDLRLLIAGLSSKRPDPMIEANLRNGNFVGVASFCNKVLLSETIREKHHRWRLDPAQIAAYGLEGMLDVRRDWWEDIDLFSRRVDFTVFQRGSILAAMICEDLARVDPCQELIRAIGPNLVISLLMDAPQLRTRWPARYATILAEDPGSSVLTLTSRGLMTNQLLNTKWPAKDFAKPIIALWRDQMGVPIEIECPYHCHGVWLKLLGKQVPDFTLDGRVDGSAVSWIRGKHVPLAVPNVDTRFPHIVGPEDMRMRSAAKPSEGISAADRASQ